MKKDNSNGFRTKRNRNTYKRSGWIIIIINEFGDFAEIIMKIKIRKK